MADAEGTLPGAAAPRPAWGFRGPASAAVFACVCLGTLLLLGGALFFGATHRSASDPEELDLRHWRPTSTEHRGQQPSLLFKQVLEGADLAVELEGFTAKEVNLSKLEDQRIHLHTASREALLNFTFRANDRPTTLKRFYFTLFVSPLRAVRVWNFSRFCWDLASDVEHLSQSEGREVLLRNVGLSQGGEDRRKRAVSFEFQATSNFMVSITQGDEDDRGMEMFFSGQQVVSEVCEVSGHLKDGMTVEIIQGEFKGYRGRVRLGDGRFQVQLANGTKLRVGELQCRILEEDLHVLESEWKAEHLQHRCEGLVDAERTCSQDGCTVLLAPEVLSCEGYCQAHGIHCNQAWRSHGDSCHGATPATCAGEMRMRGDRLLCRCQALGLSRLGQEVPLNAHVLVDRHTGVVTKGPDHDGHVRVKMPKLLTLDRPFFRPWDADAAAQPRPWHGSCDELRQGDPVQLTEGHFRGHRGAVERCDPVSKQYTVILDQWLHVSAYNLVVLHCSALQPLGQNCSEDQCQIRPHSHRESCEQFCHAAEMRCFRAWRGQKGRCDMDQPLPCSAGAGTEKVCECAPDVYAGGNCFRHDLSYEPLNMPGQLRSHERSAKACAERCASVLGCAHFSYWSDGGCHLQDRHARLLGRPGVVVGPGDCLAAAARERPAEIGETDLCQAGVSYRPLDMDGQHRSHEPDLQHCAERCAAVAGCAHFSYWSDGGCHLQDSDAKEQSTLGAIAGHPKCQTDSGSSSATVRGVATTTTAPEEPGARASATARAAPSRAACAGLVDVVQYCSASKGCKATVRRMAQRSCFDYCEQLSSSCSRAFIGGCHGEEVDCDEITGSDAMTCHCHGGRADLRRSEAQELHQSQEEVQTWQFHCHEGSPKTWDMEKRWWCCRELEIGCGARSCWQAQHEGDWSMENRMWCCRAQQVGCDHEEVHHFDCSNGLRNWRNGWSPLKKKYCCKREHRGCDGTVAHREEEMPDSMQKVLIGGAMISNYRTRPQQPAEAFRWLTRSGGPVVFCILSGVAAASILHLLWKARSEGALSDSALKEGYLPVATEESF